jgi:site-specific DNA recombinase
MVTFVEIMLVMGKKACTAHTTKEDFLKETILYDIQNLLQEIDKEQYLKELETKSKNQRRIFNKNLISSTSKWMF